MFNWLGGGQKACLGIDFGTAGLKVVELLREKERIHLSNYALAQTKIDSGFSIAKLDPNQMASLLEAVFKQAGIKSRKAVISLSVGNTFSTIIDLPFMDESELARAIPFEARKYVPVPMEEVVLDWSLVGEFAEQKAEGNSVDSLPSNQESKSQAQPASFSKKTMQVLIVAVPQELIKKIAQIAKKINLKVLAVEQEAFSIIRSLVGNDQAGYLIADLGQENTDLIIVDQGAIRLTHTLSKIAPPLLAQEMSRVINSYQARYKRKIAKIILTGGRSGEAKWREAISSELKMEVGLGNPFVRLAYDQRLEAAINQLGPFMSVAVGGAMREI